MYVICYSPILNYFVTYYLSECSKNWPKLMFSHLQNRLNITKTIRKYSIDPDLRPTGTEFHSGPVGKVIKHGDETDEEYSEGSASLTAQNFYKYSHQ